MHEAGLVRDVLEHASRAARDEGGRLRAITLRLGASSGIDAGAVLGLAELIAEEMWGYRPEIEVAVGSDPLDPGAHGLALVSVRVGGD